MITEKDTIKAQNHISDLADIIIELPFLDKEILTEKLTTHLTLILSYKEKLNNEGLQKRHDQLVIYKKQLELIGKKNRVREVEAELLEIKTNLKNSNRIIFNTSQINRYSNIKNFIKQRYGMEFYQELLKDFSPFEDYNFCDVKVSRHDNFKIK